LQFGPNICSLSQGRCHRWFKTANR
jgi:hypothetical protein